MPSPMRDKNYIKIFVLYLLKNIGKELDFNTINDVVLCEGYIEYFDFAECFAEMLDNGQIEEIRSEGTGVDMYRITPSGAAVAESLSDGIFTDIRAKSLRSALKLISFKERGAKLDYSCVESKTELGGYLVTCSIIEHDEVIFSTTLKVDSRERADIIRRNFHERPEVIYKWSTSLLFGDVNLIF